MRQSSPSQTDSDLKKEGDWPALLKLRQEWRSQGLKVVWTNGCFDILHAGHIRSLTAARNLGDILVVGLNSDVSVRKLKGLGRPILRQEERAEILAALSCVDAVIIFDEITPEPSLARLKPDIHCKGMEYAPPHGKPIPEKPLIESYGGRVEFLPMISGVSTTDVVERILARRPASP